MRMNLPKTAHATGTNRAFAIPAHMFVAAHQLA
jgi:hypothetical protein